MAIKIMPSEYGGERKGFGGPIVGALEERAGIILVVCLVILVLVSAASFGLWAYKDNLSKKKEAASNEITSLQAQRDIESEANLLALDKTIKSLDKILQDRIYPLKVFPVVENLCLPDAVFSDFSVNLTEAKMNFGILVPDYHRLAAQILAFENDLRTKNVDFSSISSDEEGRVAFNMDIELDSDVLQAD